MSNKKPDNLALVLIVLALLVFGLVMVYDSSVVSALKDFKDSYFYIRQQLIWAVIGIFSAAFFASFDYHLLKKVALPMILVSFGLLVAVFVPGLGVAGGGAHRWLDLGFLTIQPAEIMKMTGVIYLASIFDRPKHLKHFVLVVVLITFITVI